MLMRNSGKLSRGGGLSLRFALWGICTIGLIVFARCSPDAVAGTVEIKVVDDNGKPLPCRIHIKDAAGRPQRVGGLPFWRDHFVCPGSIKWQPHSGRYTFEIERGPEYERQTGSLKVAETSSHRISIRLRRIADLAAAGWYSGDLHVHRPVEDVKLLMRAEDLHVAPVITWWNNRNLWAGRQLPANPLVKFDGNRFYHVMAGEDEREGGALMYFRLHKPLEITGSSREYPSPMKFIAAARQRERVWIDIEKPFWWDVPIWLASGQIDSIGLANNHMCRSRMYETEAWGRPRDAKRLPAPLGNGYWTQEIYYHILNCGLRIPPSAGSASGVLPNPVGYNRVYVHTGKNFSDETWWKGLKAGRSFVTNGPLLLCKANGQRPGHVFTADEGESIEIGFDVSLTTNDRVPALEIIKNGRIERRVGLEKSAKSGDIGTVTFRKSGWFLVRAMADNKRTFRFASTAPFYVEIGTTKRRISKHSAEFFLEWVEERAKRVESKLDDAQKLSEVLAHHQLARRFWQQKVKDANAP